MPSRPDPLSHVLAASFANRIALAVASVDEPLEDDEGLCIPDCDGLRADCRCLDNIARPGC